MFKKIIALVIGLSMILSMSLVAFSLDEQQNFVTNAKLESSFEIIEPKVKLKKELYIRDNLLVSIYISEEFESFQVPLEMNLYRIEEFVDISNGIENGPSLEDGELDEEISLDNVIFRDVLEKDIINMRSEKVSKAYKDLDGYKKYLNKVLKLTRSEIVKLEAVEISTVKKEADKITEKTKTEVKDGLTTKDVIVNSGSEANLSKEEKQKSAKLILLYEKVLAEIDLVDYELDKIENVYNSLFERKVNESIMVEKSGLLPYFKYTFEGLDSGNYRLEFLRKDNDIIVKTVDFSINKKSQLTEEKIKENITESLNILSNNNN